MKKLAILTLVINNYGTKLQSFALCKAIQSLNLVDPEVITLRDSWCSGTVKISRKKQLLDVLRTYKLKSFKKIYDFVRWNYQYKKIRECASSFVEADKKKDKLFGEFDKHIPYSKISYTLDDVRAGGFQAMISFW